MDEFLVVDAAEPAGGKPARKGHLHFIVRTSNFGFWVAWMSFRFAPGDPQLRTVQRLSINSCDVRHVLGRFQPAFDLQRSHTRANEFGQHFQSGQVLWAEQIFSISERHQLAIADQFIRHAAGLRAFAAVRRAAAKRFTGQALARIGDAESAMNEDLERKCGMRNVRCGRLIRAGGINQRGLNLVDLLERALARENDELAAESFGELHARGAGNGHLRRGVDWEIG